MSYKIECVIQEMLCDAFGKLTGLKIKGADGYLLRQNGKEYNVFCPEKMPEKDNPSSCNAVFFSADTMLSLVNPANADLSQILTQAKCANKKVRLEIDKAGIENDSKEDNLIVLKNSFKSVAIL